MENDWLEAIVALPDQLFYNTGISTYFWMVSNRKTEERQGKVQLVDARDLFVKMRKSLGEKRNEISDEQIAEITRLHGAFAEGDSVKIVDSRSFGYRTIAVEQPLCGYWQVGPATWDGLEEDPLLAKLDMEERASLRVGLRTMDDERYRTKVDFVTAMAKATSPSPSAKASVLGLTPAQTRKLAARAFVRDPDVAPLTDAKGNPLPDPERRDTENIPLGEDVEAYLEREVRPHVPGAWCPEPDGKIGYEIPFVRFFYRHVPPRPSAAIKAELKELEAELHRLLAAVLE